MEIFVARYIVSVGNLIWEKNLLYCTRPIMTNASTKMAVYHIGDAVCEFTLLKLGHKAMNLE